MTHTLCPDCGQALVATGNRPAAARFCVRCQRFWTAQTLTERGATRAPAGTDQAQLPGFEDVTPSPRKGFWD